MASFVTKCMARSMNAHHHHHHHHHHVHHSTSALKLVVVGLRICCGRSYAAKAAANATTGTGSNVVNVMREREKEKEEGAAFDEDDSSSVSIPTSGISRPISEILKELNKRVPDSLVRVRTEPDGFPVKYIPWHIVNRIMNLHAPEWSGEVRSITYSADGNSVSVVYRVTLYGTDAEMYRESTGTASVSETGYGDPIQKAEAMAFRRACARFGLGLHLYHEDML